MEWVDLIRTLGILKTLPRFYFMACLGALLGLWEMVYRATVQIGREKPMPSKSIGKHLPARDPAIEGTDRADPKRLYDSLL